MGWTLFAVGLLAGTADRPAEAQATPAGIKRAASATELPLGAWGPYATGSLAPCYLADRFKAQLFTFPLVIGQRRTESLLRPVLEADGKTHLRLQKVALERRSLGLSPVQAANDDLLETAAALYGNRVARVVDADADGFLWTVRIPFAPAKLAQAISGPADSEEAGWGSGEATISFTPAFAEPNRDGLLLHVTLTNRSNAVQTWYVDMLGGLSLLSEGFDLKDLVLRPDPDGKAMRMRHKSSEAAFALAADTAPYPVHTYTVRSAYFAPESSITDRDTKGVALPAGRIGPKDGAEENIAKAGPEALSAAGLWALTRVDDISVAPGESVTFTLCIGVAKETEDARHSAAALSLLALDGAAEGKPGRTGIYSKTAGAHRSALTPTGDAALDRLLAQSFANVPFDTWRRVGVPSRQWPLPPSGAAYHPVEGGFLALGWADTRPDWAAAQINAFFLTGGDPEAPFKSPQTIAPINLFALWELYEQTLDRKLLAQFYPFARRRYRELLTTGRVNTTDWLFSWKNGNSERETDKGTVAAALQNAMPRRYSPDYSAFVVRSARMLQRMATILERSPNELSGYAQNAEDATKALNASLWDGNLGAYVSRPAMPSSGVGTAQGTDDLTSLLPLICGSDTVNDLQRTALLKQLTDPTRFWSEAGLRSVSKSATGYRPHEPGNGAVTFGTNWLLWKALLEAGETETAQKLATNLLRAYDNAQNASDACPEALDGDTGLACGATDVSGDAGILLSLRTAYHRPGTATGGWNLLPLDRHYDRGSDILRLVYRSVEKIGRTSLLCVMGKPNGKYTVQGPLMAEMTADANGLLTLSLSPGSSTQELVIQPSGSAKP